MAIGDLVVLDYQYEYGNLLLGAATEYRVMKIEGLLSTPDVRNHDIERQDRHGAIFGRDLMSGRKITMELAVESATQAGIEGNLRQLAAVFRPSSSDIPFVFQRPGGGVKKRINCRPRRREFVADYDVTHCLAMGAVEMFAADPRIYSNVVSTSGLTIPNAGTSATTVINSPGDFPTAPTLTIGGPCTNPRISNTDDANRQIRLDVVMISTDVLVVDVNARTVTLNGADRYDLVRSDNQWWELQAGDNHITYSRTGTPAASTLTLSWRDAWV